MHTVAYKTAGGRLILADVYLPQTDGPHPVLLWIHGGALIVGSRDGIHPAQRDQYLEGGYALISIDYRLAPEAKLPAILEDLQDAAVWIREQGPRQFGIDPDRLAVIGHSAGGYLTLLSGYCVEPRPRALVSFYGYGDIAGAWYSQPDPFYNSFPPVDRGVAYASVGGEIQSHTDVAESAARHRFYLYCRQQGLWPQEVTGHDPHTELAAFAPLCPLRNVSAAYPPTLLVHGDQDTDVPYEQSVLMAQALEHAGVENELLTHTGGPHGFDYSMEDPIVVAQFARVLSFLSRHV